MTLITAPAHRPRYVWYLTLQLVESRADLAACQTCAEAEVNAAAAESEVRVRLPLDVESPRVTTRAAPSHRDCIPRQSRRKSAAAVPSTASAMWNTTSRALTKSCSPRALAVGAPQLLPAYFAESGAATR
jgi:hypothetical protein